ncbi:hypothetical protein BB561_005730 [Smittium simulii]|uniref:GDP-Man:Man(3)GlcNAc(2)-PP-Dol alpha-1,2-mannosyltransferase n=1 Tax=Smittium simulii TaxID=133385 RepID=A0A2T9Y8S1_9FUNG|nr:hypothetical protein BB561_005730 [Smittium simulii]
MFYFNLTYLTITLFVILLFTAVTGCFILKYYLDSAKEISNELRNIAIDSLPEKAIAQDYRFIGFFHPYATVGGGGERVLWTMIKALQDSNKKAISVVYTAYKDDEDKQKILEEVKKKFRIEIDPDFIIIIRLNNLKYVDTSYPRLRLLMQSLGSMLLCFEALSKFTPDIYIDTVGYAFTYPLVQLLFRIKVVSYTHYPTISSDMYQVVASRESGINNDPVVHNSLILSFLKKVISGSFCYSVMTNSSWTYNHIKATFKKSKSITIVYPPCDTEYLSKFSLDDRKLSIVSLAQFRPEKDHSLQLEAFAKLLHDYPEWRKTESNHTDGYIKLIMIGGVRNSGDQARADKLRELSKSLKIDDQVEIVTNAPYSYICEQLQTATAGIHSMKDEHFGINIVEFMAAGLVPISHNSAGPKMDIVVPGILPENVKNINSSLVSLLLDDAKRDLELTDSSEEKFDTFPVGFLASDADEFAQAINCVFSLDKHVLKCMQTTARNRAINAFSEEKFKADFLKTINFAFRYNIL